MKHIYLKDYTSSLERVLSVGYKYKYSTRALEKLISYSDYFRAIERDANRLPPIIDERTLVDKTFPEFNITIDDTPTYNQCLWAAEAYLRIQGATKLTIECIFLYIPIKKMYSYFDLYHEMDFSQIIDEFNRLYKQRSALEIIIDNYRFSIKSISENTGISYDVIFSLKKRRRDIKKTGVEIISSLARYLRVQIDTLAEIRI